MRLTEEQREQLFNTAVDVYREDLGPRHVRKVMRDRLYGMGWEMILIQFVLPIIIALIKEWMKKKAAPTEMPMGFFVDE
jgi:hypothetical protein